MYYLVTMYRWGDPEEHNYCIGCFTKKFLAEEIGKWERKFRGGKYDPFVTEVDVVPEYLKLNEVCEDLKIFIKRGATGYCNLLNKKLSK